MTVSAASHLALSPTKRDLYISYRVVLSVIITKSPRPPSLTHGIDVFAYFIISDNSWHAFGSVGQRLYGVVCIITPQMYSLVDVTSVRSSVQNAWNVIA